ncbi:MAG: S8 family serine peptidase [Blastocatellia bacterium]|nr:S8 family serine peptidase [Blastocatellia bacterium]
MYTSLKPENHNHSHAPNRFAVLPTPVRLEALPELTGKGVTIAFLDSGFYPHPDLTMPQSRIRAFVDIADPAATLDPDKEPEGLAWHGTQTSVSAAGNGYYGDGTYRGIASNADVVLVKVSEKGRITEPNIERGLRWVIENREKYNIRIVNISLGGDADVSYKENIVDLAAEEAVKLGLVIVVAAGNSGDSPDHFTVPPANAPSVITVGGYDDKNRFRNRRLDLYHSNYGQTVDGIVKPEIVAPAIWVAAPILPNTPLYKKAETLAELDSSPDFILKDLVRERAKEAELPATLHQKPIPEIRAAIDAQLKANKLTSAHYQHVDGTSFAAPIVCSVIAQMLEANPKLTPGAIKHILISTADRIPGKSVIRQGYGVINVQRAVNVAKQAQYTIGDDFFLPPRVEEDKLIFFFHDKLAKTVHLAGDFNQWNATATPFAFTETGVWKAEIDVPPSGKHRYKIVLDGNRWLEDPSNGLKETDGYGGFNSVLNFS